MPVRRHNARRLRPGILLAATIALAVLPWAGPAMAADVMICNETGTDVRAATAAKTMFDRSWGWTRIPEGDCRSVAGRYDGGALYFYVEYQSDPFSTENQPYKPKGARYSTACVKTKTNFDYLYNDRGCGPGMVERDFFEYNGPGDGKSYTITLR